MANEKIYPIHYSRTEIKIELEKMLTAIEKQTDSDSIDYLIKYAAKYQAGTNELNDRNSRILNIFLSIISIISLFVAIMSYIATNKSAADSKYLFDIRTELVQLNKLIDSTEKKLVESFKNNEMSKNLVRETPKVENSQSKKLPVQTKKAIK